MFPLRPLVLLLLPLCPGPGPGPGSEAKVTRSCAETRQVLGARGYSLNLIPPALISGEHLRVCPQEYTCCSSETEQRLIRETEATFRSLVEDSGSFLVHTLAARHRKFDEFFLEMLSVAQHSLTQLFSHSYGRLYAQHALIFNGLFSRLRDFYGESGEGLDDTLADFWAQLLERVFPLLHPQYSFPPDYLLCLSRLASSTDGSLQPFGDSPRRLRLQITRTLVAARAFVQGLETGRNVVSEALKVPLSEGCSQALMRLIGCPLCRGVPSLMPCQGFCLNVVRGCLSSRGLEPDWGNYLDGLLILADKLQGPFSFELAAESIGVKISEGLMYLQENSAKVSAQVRGREGWRVEFARQRGKAQTLTVFFSSVSVSVTSPTPLPGCSLLLCTYDFSVFSCYPISPSACLFSLCLIVSHHDLSPLCLLSDLSLSLSPCLPITHGLSPLPNPASTCVSLPCLSLSVFISIFLCLPLPLPPIPSLSLFFLADEDASGSGGGQQYADDWMAGAVAPPARPPRPPYPPRRDGSGGKGGGGSARYNQGRSRSAGASIGFHTQTILILSVSALALLGPR
ncbi:hypothetical protein EGM_12409 [Macaca fascicularis]|uniref:Glypican 2 n=2 Tax=Cercopithecinae TaxID=9528 RepID=G7P0D0_MACFA|nr:hypothetical protein EGM_12409 [Macaca fascicularis]